MQWYGHTLHIEEEDLNMSVIKMLSK